MAQSARGPLAPGYSKTSRQLSLSIGAIVYASLYLLYRSLVVRTIKERGLHEKPTKGLQQGRHAGARLSDGHLTQQHLSNSSGAEVTESAGLIAETPTAHLTLFLRGYRKAQRKKSAVVMGVGSGTLGARAALTALKKGAYLKRA